MAAIDSVKPHMPESVPASPFYSEEHEAFRNTVRRFVEREIMPPPPASQRQCVTCEFQRFCNDVV